MLEKTLESCLNSKEIKSVNLKGNQPWILPGRTDAETKLQYFDHLIRIANPLEKSLMLAKIEGRRRRGCQRMRWLIGITDAMDMSLGKFWEMVREAWCAVIHEITELDTTRQVNNNVCKAHIPWWIIVSTRPSYLPLFQVYSIEFINIWYQ